VKLATNVVESLTDNRIADVVLAVGRVV